MSVSRLLDELANATLLKRSGGEDASYDNLSDAEIVARLNEWQTTWIPCAASSLKIKFAELMLPARVALAVEKKRIDEQNAATWELLLKFSEGNPTDTVLFNEQKIDALFAAFQAAGVITDTELTWLLDLGRNQKNIARQLFNRDLDEATVAASKELAPLKEKIDARRAEIQQFIADVQVAHDELNRLDGALNPIADKDYVVEWEKAADVKPAEK